MAEPFVITTTVDASGVGPGVAQTVDGLTQIEQAAHKATESTHTLQGEQLGSIRTAHHLFEGLVELGQGGTAALGGLALEGRIVSEVFESMLGPLAPLAIILTTLAAVGIPALTRAWGQNKEEAKAAAEATKEALEASLKSYDAYIDGILAKQKQLLAQDDELRASAKDEDGLAATAAKQEKERQLGSLRDQFLKDQATPMTGSERDELKQRYEAAKKDIEEGSTVNTAVLEAAEKQRDLELAQQKLADARANNAADTLEAAEKFNRAAAAKAALEPYGISYDSKAGTLTRIDPNAIDDKTNPTGEVNPIEEQNKKIADDEAALRHSDLAYIGGNVTVEEKQQYDAEINQRLIEERKRRDELQGYQRDLALGGEAEKKFGPKGDASLDKQATEISKLERQVEELKAQLAQATTGVQLAVQSKDQDDQQRAIDEANRKAAEATKLRVKQLEADNQRLEHELAAATSQGQKESIRQEIDKNKALIASDQDPNQQVDPRPLRQGSPQPYARVPARNAEGIPVPTGEGDAALREAVNEAQGLVTKFGSKQDVAQMQQLIQALRGNPQAELTQLIKELIDIQVRTKVDLQQQIRDLTAQVKRFR